MRLTKIIFYIFFLHMVGNSQVYNYFHYDIKDGLSGINVYAIAQDKDGFLWFGTETGLSRFDGSHFKNFSTLDGLSEAEIINLFVDSKNRIWIFPFKNSICYYYHGKIFNNSNDTLLRKFHQKNEIFDASEDKEGNIFFLELDVLHILTVNNEVKEITKIDNKPFYLDASGISADGNCNLFVSFFDDIKNRRISRYEWKNNQFIEKEIIHDDNFSRNNLEFNPHYTSYRNKDFFEIADHKTNKKFTFKIPIHFHTVSDINDSCFAISTSDKTYLFNVNQQRIVDSFLFKKTVNRCFRDNEDNLWFGTAANGLYRLSSTEFKLYALENGNLPAFTLSRFKNYLYIGSSKMLLWNLNLETNELKKIQLGTEYNIGKVSSIQPLNDKNLFAGTDNGFFKISNNHIEGYFPRTSVKSLFLHGDSLLVGSDRFAFDINIHSLNKTNTIWHGRVTSACKFKDRYYIGTLGSLNVVDNNVSFSLLKDKIVAIALSPNNDMWVATGNSGLVCIRDGKIIYHITTANGLTSNLCRCLCLSNDIVWLGTERGISKIDLSVHPFNITHFTAAEGLDCEIVNSIYAQGDSVFAGTPFGVTFFNAGRVKTKSICKLRLVDIQSKNFDWFYNQDSIHLSSNDNFLQFQYAGISFVSSGDITYYYQLLGLDDSWQLTKQNSVAFESLPAGNYTFKIYAINKYGIKSKTISIFFTKEKTFWQLWWFQTILLVCSIVLMSLLIWLRIKSIKRSANNKVLRERKIHELEQMAFRAQMNPHFIFNSLNSLQQYVFGGNVLEANQFITAFSSLIRQTLYISEKLFITLAEEIKYLDTYLKIEQTKYDNNFDYFINANNIVQREKIIIPPLLLQPYLENSIRHGILNLEDERGRVFINFTVEGHFLICILEDNGIGRENANKLKKDCGVNHSSMGMQLVKKRIESLKNLYKIEINVLIEDIKKDNQTGTRVIIKLPLNYDEQ